MALKDRIKYSKYEKIILDFIDKKGVFITYTKDNMFIKLLTRMVVKQLGIQKPCVITASSQKDLLSKIASELKVGNRVVLFLERVIDGIQTTNLITTLKETFKNKILIIMLTTEVEKEILIKFFELGVNNFITKPLSVNTLIEKIAFTLKPPSKLGEKIEEARRLLQKGQYKAALKKCDEILKVKPNSAAVYILKGDIYKVMGDVEKAKEFYLKAHHNWQLFLDPLKKLAELAKEQGNKEELLEVLKKLDKLSPLNIDRKVEIGTTAVELGKKEEGEQYLDEAIKIAAKHAKEELGNLALKIADGLIDIDASLAEKFYRKALDIKKKWDVSDIETFNRLGICLRQQKKPLLAIEEYKKALKLDPYNERIMYNMALAYLEAKEVEKARDLINVMLRRNPDFGTDNEVVLYNIGMIYYKAQEFDKAKEFFKRSLQTNPDYTLAQQMLQRLS